MEKIELLAPAGDLEKLKIAILYGADAVFIGGKELSLRSRASNFTLDDIAEACAFAHNHNAKIHVTCNIVMHNKDTSNVLNYLKSLESCGVDAIITSSLYIITLVKKYTKMEAHASTQMSTANSYNIKLLEKLGVDRVVLAREVTMDEMEIIKTRAKVDIEAFIHGGMCASYSGRCMLSNNMSNRDANRGGCAHSCRWNYELLDKNNTKINPDNSYFSLSCKDLCGIKAIPRLIDIGINSLKIEGRMKSLHYIATVVNAYRKIIDEYYETHNIKDFNKYIDAINKAENRLTSTGFLFNKPDINEQLFDDYNSPTKEFIGIVLDYDDETKMVTVEQRNHFKPNSIIEVFSPTETFNLNITEIFDLEGNSLDAARHPRQIVKFKSDIKLNKNDLLRLT